MERRHVELTLRRAGQKVVALTKKLQAEWARKKDAGVEGWGEVCDMLDAVDAVVAALEVAGRFDARQPAVPKAVGRVKEPVAPLELLSLTELAAVNTALEIVALWGVASAVDAGLRSVGRGRTASRSAKVPLAAQKRRVRRAPEGGLERMWATLAGALGRESLGPVMLRFVADGLVLALELDRRDKTTTRARDLALSLPAEVSARAVREVLGGAVSDVGEHVPAPQWCAAACGSLLAAIARSDLSAILAEFAGEDEVRASTGGDAPNVEKNLAAALASVDLTDDDGYVKDIVPQLVTEATTKATFEGDAVDDVAQSARSRIATRALARLADRSSSIVLAAAAGSLFTHDKADERQLAKDRDILMLLADGAELAGPFLLQGRVVAALLALADFCAASSRTNDLGKAACVLAALARADPPRFAALVDDALSSDPPLFGPGDAGGVELRGATGGTWQLADTAEAVFGRLRDAPVVASLFAQLLRTHLTDETKSGARLLCLIRVADLLDARALDTGTAVIDTLAAVLAARAKAATRLQTFQVDDNEEEDDDGDEDDALEQVALGTLLAILEVGAAERPDEDEAALKTLLPALEVLSRPSRAGGELAAECRARVLRRGAAKLRASSNSSKKGRTSWRDALAEARADLANFSSPAMRAYGIVSLTNFARAVTQRKDAIHKSRGENLNVDAPGPGDWRPVATALVEALADNDSYVFLAAAHSLAALADANPTELVPFLCEIHETSKLDDLEIGDAARARLGEALACTIKRRGAAAPAYVPKLARALVRGARPDAPDPSPNARCAAFSNLADLASLAGVAVRDFALDAVDLVLMTLDLEEKDRKPSDAGFSTRRAAAFLGRQLLAGTHCIEAAPRPTARMCRKLKAIVDDDADDDATRHHAALALQTLNALLDAKLRPDASKKIEDILPVFRDDWLAVTGSSRDKNAAAAKCVSSLLP